jgi:selenocysteine lyase/cysteine desulfurase
VDIDALRAQTPGCAGRIHLNNAGAGLLAQPTLDAMTAQLRREAEIGGYEAAAAAQDAIAATYNAIAGLVGGRSDEIALFDNATHAWNAAFYSVPLRSGDQILTGRAEYGSNVLAYWQAARRTGAEVIVVPNDEHGQLDVAALERLAGERTKLIGVSHVPTSGGLVQPTAQIGRIARACGALYLLDATQSAGQFPVDVGAVGCDMLTGTGRKFLRGPRGSGFLWVRTAALDRLDPFVAEIGSATWDGHQGFTWAPGARRFATWEHSYVNVLGLGAAVRQALDVGLGAIGQRAVALGARLRGQLAELPGVTVHDLGRIRCAIVTAKVDGLAAEQAAQVLARAGVNVSTTVPGDNPLDTQDRGVHPLIRFSPHYYNTEDEIDRATELVAGLAGLPVPHRTDLKPRPARQRQNSPRQNRPRQNARRPWHPSWWVQNDRSRAIRQQSQSSPLVIQNGGSVRVTRYED